MKKGRKTLFGTDGVRGHANQYPMTVEIAQALGKATALVLKRGDDNKKRVVVGKDTRLSCYMFENALIAGLCSMGVDTLMVGPLPTPGVAFITRAYRANAGIMISASHNPFYDNGIKIFTSDGYKLPDELEDEIALMVEKGGFSEELPQDQEVGRNKRIHDSDGRYIEFAKATFPKKKTLGGFKIVLDCANGAAHRVAPLVFQELDADVVTYANEPNGININQNCGSLHPWMVQKGVIEHQADVGIALDGDGDRVIMIDEKAQIVDGDTILAICAKELKKRGELQGDRVVGTVMTNVGVIKTLQECGIEVIQSKVGDRYVIHEMLAHQISLGGEQSGHLIFFDYNTTGDGIVSALQVLKIMKETHATLSDLAATVKKYPQSLINVPVSKKIPLEKVSPIQKAIKEVEKLLGDSGRVLIRYSGTESLCRVMVEGEKKHEVDKYARNLAQIVENELHKSHE